MKYRKLDIEKQKKVVSQARKISNLAERAIEESVKQARETLKKVRKVT